MMFWVRFIAICIAGGILGFWRQTIGESVYIDYYGRLISVVTGSTTFGMTFIAVYFLTRTRFEKLADFLSCFLGAIFTFINLNILKDVMVQLIALDDVSISSLVRDVKDYVNIDGLVVLFLIATAIYFCASFLFLWAVKLLAKFVKEHFAE